MPELNPSPKFPIAEKPHLSPNPKFEDSIVDGGRGTPVVVGTEPKEQPSGGQTVVGGDSFADFARSIGGAKNLVRLIETDNWDFDALTEEQSKAVEEMDGVLIHSGIWYFPMRRSEANDVLLIDYVGINPNSETEATLGVLKYQRNVAIGGTGMGDFVERAIYTKAGTDAAINSALGAAIAQAY